VATATKAPPRPSKNHDVSPRIAQRAKWREQLAAAEASADQELAAALQELEVAKLPSRERGGVEFLSGLERLALVQAGAKVSAATTVLEHVGKKYREALRNDLTPGDREEISSFVRELGHRRMVLFATSKAPEEATRAVTALNSLAYKTDAEKEMIRHNARVALEALERAHAVGRVLGEVLQEADSPENGLTLQPDYRAKMRELRQRVLDVEAAEYHVEIP
jgi:hypothetical protein